eukprot:121237_1
MGQRCCSYKGKHSGNVPMTEEDKVRVDKTHMAEGPFTLPQGHVCIPFIFKLGLFLGRYPEALEGYLSPDEFRDLIDTVSDKVGHCLDKYSKMPKISEGRRSSVGMFMVNEMNQAIMDINMRLNDKGVVLSSSLGDPRRSAVDPENTELDLTPFLLMKLDDSPR